MRVRAVEIFDMQRDPGVLRERVKELAEQLGVHLADLRDREFNPPDQIGPPGCIQRHARECLIHRQLGRTVAPDAAPIAQRLGQRLAQRDAAVLDRMMRVDMQIALGAQRDVDQ